MSNYNAKTVRTTGITNAAWVQLVSPGDLNQFLWIKAHTAIYLSVGAAAPATVGTLDNAITLSVNSIFEIPTGITGGVWVRATSGDASTSLAYA